MAKIIENSNELLEQYKSNKRKKNIALILFLGTLIYIFTTGNFDYAISQYAPMLYKFTYKTLYLAWILMIIEIIIYNHYKKKTNSLQSGVEGESNLKSIIRKLPDDYKAVTNVIIEFEGKSSELDLVLIGKSGVFVIETKNHNGTIVGVDTDEQWTQNKVGQKGGRYSKTFYNPIKQVSTHVYRLSNVFKVNGINVWVQGIVYFSNKSTSVKINNTKNKVPVYAASNGGVNEMIQYIYENQGKNPIDTATIDKMLKLLN